MATAVGVQASTADLTPAGSSRGEHTAPMDAALQTLDSSWRPRAPSEALLLIPDHAASHDNDSKCGVSTVRGHHGSCHEGGVA